MAKDRRKLQHIHSSVPDRQPTPSTLEVGEIAVNNAKDQEFLSIKNSNNKVVRFSSDEQIMTWTEKKEVIPYKGYVRGEIGPSSTSGDAPTSDAYGSYGITDNDLLVNKSNIIIKLNQVAADNTNKHNKVNGAKDSYNKLVNPTEDGGITDGAGFYIDMSRYAMQGANPEFSGVTTTCYSVLNGRTEILGGDETEGDCRSLFNVDVISANTNAVTINNSATTINNNADTINNTVNNFNISGDTYISGTITIGTQCDQLSSTTIDSTFCEVFDRSKVTMTRIDDPEDTRLSAIYRLWQDDIQIGYDINVPKDGFLKNVELVEEGDIYYLRFTWWIYDADSGEYRTGTTDVNVEDLVKDIEENNTNEDRGVNVGIWYNEITKKMNVSADTKLHFSTPSDTNNFAYSRSGGEHYESGTTIVFKSGAYSATSTDGVAKYKPWSASTEINIPTCASQIARAKLAWEYGNVCGVSGNTYDPGDNCNDTVSRTIRIPGTIADLTNNAISIPDACSSGECITISKDICMSDNTIVAKGFFSRSDIRSKENINDLTDEDIKKVNKVGFKSFNFKNDETKTKTYGVIAQDVQAAGLDNIIHTTSEGMLNVDYVSLLLLKIASMEKTISNLREDVNLLNNKINFGK